MTSQSIVSDEAMSQFVMDCNQVCQGDTCCLPLCSVNSLKYFNPISAILNSTGEFNNSRINGVEEVSNLFISRPSCVAQGLRFRTVFYHSLEELAKNTSSGTFCISGMSANGRNGTKIISVLTCGDKWPYEQFGLSLMEAHLYGICSTVSLAFTFLALIIYLILWKRHTVHTWTQFCYILSLFGVYVSIVREAFFPENRNDLCTLRQFLSVLWYRFVSSQILTWLAILSFDLFMSFWRLKPSVGLSNGKPSLKRFYIYLSIGWMAPITAYVIAYLLNRHKREEPGYYCAPIGDHPVARLYSLFAGLLNIAFFTATFIQIMKHRRNSKFASQNASRQESHLLSLFTKLFLITGITCSGVIVDIVAKTYLNRSSIPLFVFRSLICLQGLVVFIVFLCNKKTWDQLVQKFPKLKELSIRQFGSFVTGSSGVSRISNSLEMNQPKI